MMKKIIVFGLLCVFFIIDARAKEVPFTLEDRDRLIRVEAKLEEIDKRFEQIDRRFDQMMNFMWILAVVFCGITASTIGFAIWDRKTMIRPFEIKVKGIEEELRDLDKRKLAGVIEALKRLAEVNEEVAKTLKKFNLS